MIEALMLTVALAGKADFDPPEYRGYHYSKKAEKFLTCVAERESSFGWRADSKYGSGIVQWIQPTWDHYVDRAGYPEWVGVRPYKAPKYVQWSTAFVQLDPYPKKKGLEGRHHWSSKHALTIGKKIKDC
jgi:hypothetical protein